MICERHSRIHKSIRGGKTNEADGRIDSKNSDGIKTGRTRSCNGKLS